jgi:hypothetical protein
MMDGYDWWALIGPVPAPHPAGIIAVPHDRTAYLDREYSVGPVSLEPGGRRLTEYLRSEPYRLDAVTWFETWPVIVKGKWPGTLPSSLGQTPPHNGHEANLKVVSSWLHRIVCLISFAVGEGWQVRTTPVEANAFPAAVPDDWPAPPIAEWGCETPDAVPRTLPHWIGSAWEALDHDNALASALSLWHQGVLLTPIAPSFAFLAFCASVEGIADAETLRQQITPTAEACPECGNVPKAVARFWATVGLVRDSEQIDALRKEVDPYAKRSGTAHGRALHGIETEYGRMHMLKYAAPEAGSPATIDHDWEDRTQAFMWHQLPEVRLVATDLLRVALKAH